MQQRKFKVHAGFTLVELLVVIGIIALLISMLMPALRRVRLQAKRTQDLSNIRQLAIACCAYAAENRGNWPLGNRQGPNLSNPPSDNDDLEWVNAYTYAYWLHFMADSKTADDWLTMPFVPGKRLDSSIARRFTCTSLADCADGGTMFSCVGLYNFRYIQEQVDPSGVGMNFTFMGYTYWGNRAQQVTDSIYDASGTAVAPASAFIFPSKQGRPSTSNVLLSCNGYVSPTNGYELPHCYTGDSYIYPNGSPTTPGNGQTGISAAMNGICCAYTDGSASWVPRRQLWSVYGNTGWFYFDGTNIHL